MNALKTIYVPSSYKLSTLKGPDLNGDDTARMIQATLEEQARAGYKVLHMQPLITTQGAFTFTEGFILVFGLA